MNWQYFTEHPWLVLMAPIIWIGKEVYSFKGRYITRDELKQTIGLLSADISYIRDRVDKSFDLLENSNKKETPEE